jgi:hypothetical protein
MSAAKILIALANLTTIIHLKTNHYLFQKYLSYWHFSIAINKPSISTYNRVSLSFDSEYRVADIV